MDSVLFELLPEFFSYDDRYKVVNETDLDYDLIKVNYTIPKIEVKEKTEIIE